MEPSGIRTTSTGFWRGRQQTSVGRIGRSRVGHSVSTRPGGREISPRRSSRPPRRPCVADVGRGGIRPRSPHCNFLREYECNGLVTNSCLTAARSAVVASLYRGAPTRPDSPLSGRGALRLQSLRGRFGYQTVRQIGTGLTTHRPTGTQSIILKIPGLPVDPPKSYPLASSPLRFRGTGS